MLLWRSRIECIYCLRNYYSHCHGTNNEGKDKTMYDKCLSLLLSQIQYEPSSSVIDLALEICADVEEEISRNVALKDFESALRDALVQIAVAAGGGNVGSDALWKPLNDGVLMFTRNTDARIRRLALSIIVGFRLSLG